MSSIYRKQNSPFWFIQFIDGNGKRRNKSTEFRADDPGETVQARALRAQLEAKELSRTAGALGGGWDTWVPSFLERHCESPLTHERYLDAWKWLAFWLQNRRFHSPRDITYRNALEYINWRTSYKKKTGKTVGRNTAIMELKVLAMLMGEAVRLGHAERRQNGVQRQRRPLRFLPRFKAFEDCAPQQKTTLTLFTPSSFFHQEPVVGQKPGVTYKNASAGNFILRPSPASTLTVFGASHGQPNWAQTGLTSRELHTNFAGVMELLCRFGMTCSPTGLEPFSQLLARARLLVIPPPAGSYNFMKRCWTPASETLFNAETIRDILRFVQDGGRLLAFAYRFGDSFTASNMRELMAPLGCLLNDDAVMDLQLLRETYPLEAYFDTPKLLLPLPWANEDVNTVRWRTMATFSILPGANVQPLALSAGGSCISFNRSLRRISFSSLPISFSWDCAKIQEWVPHELPGCCRGVRCRAGVGNRKLAMRRIVATFRSSYFQTRKTTLRVKPQNKSKFSLSTKNA